MSRPTRPPERRPRLQLTPPQARPQPLLAFAVSLGLLVAMWAQELVDQLMPFLQLDNLGIYPRDTGTWWHIFTAPFLHGGFAHIAANSVPFLALAFLSALRSVGRFFAATFIIIVVAGALVWLFGRPSYHLGASILIFGYFAYLLGVGYWERTPAAVGIAVVVAAVYGGIIWGVLPSDPSISFEGHLFGAVGGLVAAWRLHR